MNTNFIFFDQKKLRIRKVKKNIFDIFLALLLIIIISALLFLYIPDVGKMAYWSNTKKNKDTIDSISTREESQISVAGEGAEIEIYKGENGQYLLRRPFSQDKKVVLTFDDGPDPVYTPKVLEILKNENIKAMFFVVGDAMMRNPHVVKKIVDDGHIVGVHTYNHPSPEVDLYSDLGQLINKASLQIDVTQKIFNVQSGYKTRYFRVPHWGAEKTIETNSLILSVFALDRGYDVISSTVDSFDWRDTDPKRIEANSLMFKGSQAILLHDGGGNREGMIKALPNIIKSYQDAGYEFTVDGGIVDSEGAEVIQELTIYEKISAYITYFLIWMTFNYKLFPEYIFITGIFILAFSTSISLIFAVYHFIIKKHNNTQDYEPFVSVIIPAYNEENTIEKTIMTVLNSSYPNFEVLVVNNHSTDNTYRILRRIQRRKSVNNLKILTQKTIGKYAAINKGIKYSKGEVNIVIDADTQLLSNSIKEIVQPLKDKKIGAVSGYIKVGNTRSLLAKFQSIEYIAGLNLERRAYDVFNVTPVIPGAFGAWRKNVLIKAGFFSNDTLTEDADMAVRIQRLGYKTAFAPKAVAFTEVPETLKMFLKQRQRWLFGILQVLFKNKDIFFKRKYGVLAYLIFPFMVIVQLPLMLLGPAIDLLAIALLFLIPEKVLIYMAIFIFIKIIELSVSMLIAGEKDIKLILYLPVMRVVYQTLWYYNLYRCIYKAVEGEYLNWEKTDKKGLVDLSKLIPNYKSWASEKAS